MKIAFLGDMAFVGQFNITSNEFDINKLEPLKKLLENSDYVIANLESPFTNETKTRVAKSIHLSANPKNVDVLKYLGINAVSLANNHINDFGVKGIKDTINILESNGIEWFGLDGKDIVIHHEENKINVSGYACLSTNPTGYKRDHLSVNVLTYDNLNNQIKKSKEKGEIPILSLHWGLEHTNYPNPEHVSLVKKLFSTYKNVIIHGHHPHVVQGLYEENNSFCAFSLGNAIFDEVKSLNNKMVLKQHIENLESFVWYVDINKNNITSYNVCRFQYINGYIELINNDIKLDQISEFITKYKSQEYINKRINEFKNTIEIKFGKRTFKWFIKRLNFNSIINYVYGKKRIKEYSKIVNNFKENNNV